MTTTPHAAPSTGDRPAPAPFVEVAPQPGPQLDAWLDRCFDAWFDVLDVATRDGLADPVPYLREEVRTALRMPQASYRKHALAAWDGDRLVGAGRVDLPQHDNLDLAEVTIAVHPEHRRRGHGSALLEVASDLARRSGRSRFMAALDRPAGAQHWPGSAFLAARGFTLGITSIRRDLALPVEDGLLDRLDAACRPHAPGYRVLGWEGRVAPGHRLQMAALHARMSTDAPLGDLVYEQEVWDGARVLELEDRQEALGRRWWTAVAVAPDGTWAGFSQMGWSPHEPTRLHQWDTLVLREHRGRRLGTLLKVDVLRRVLPEVPEATRVSTWNAAVNAPMIAVNEALGFRPVEVEEEWQGPVG